MPRDKNQIHYGNDSWDEPGGPHLYGNLKALYRLKQAHRHLKVLLSIGGWTHSENGRFARPISTPEGRARFVETAVRLVEDDALDGLDIDFEYPQNDKEARDYVELLRLLRQGLDGLQQKLGVHGPHGFELTVAAVSAGPLSPQTFFCSPTLIYLPRGPDSPVARARLRSSAFARWTATCPFGTSWRES